MTKTTKTHAITHSPVFARIFSAPDAWSPALLCAKMRGELLHGPAAEDAFVALFDEFSDFDDMAREAVQQPVPLPQAKSSSPEPRDRQKSGRLGRGRAGMGMQASVRPMAHAAGATGQTRTHARSVTSLLSRRA